MKSSLRQAIVRQFGQPTGLVGHLVGLVMAGRPSNVGVDHSGLMHRQAARRNARAIEAGLVELHVACPHSIVPSTRYSP